MEEAESRVAALIKDHSADLSSLLSHIDQLLRELHDDIDAFGSSSAWLIDPFISANPPCDPHTLFTPSSCTSSVVQAPPLLELWVCYLLHMRFHTSEGKASVPSPSVSMDPSSRDFVPGVKAERVLHL